MRFTHLHTSLLSFFHTGINRSTSQEGAASTSVDFMERSQVVAVGTALPTANLPAGTHQGQVMVRPTSNHTIVMFWASIFTMLCWHSIARYAVISLVVSLQLPHFVEEKCSSLNSWKCNTNTVIRSGDFHNV